jgi:nucleotide-binding universal stress UspA family protein
MYKKILVPLDGSELAECVLPHVEAIAAGCDTASVVFLRVLETYIPNINYTYIGATLQQEMEGKNEKEARDYLENIAGRVKLGKVAVEQQVVTGRAAESIADYATKNKVDLIAIATHGRSGVSRWAWGSVADRVLRSACVPVLMVRAPGCVPGI